jgi:hypothetical protein
MPRPRLCRQMAALAGPVQVEIQSDLETRQSAMPNRVVQEDPAISDSSCYCRCPGLNRPPRKSRAVLDHSQVWNHNDSIAYGQNVGRMQKPTRLIGGRKPAFGPDE